MLVDRTAPQGQTRIRVGKLPTRSREVALNNLLTANQPKSILLHIKDSISGAQFLVDTGAEVSVIPPTADDRSRPSRMNLIAANGSRIKSFGTRQRPIKINNHQYDWKFHVADVQQSILGADFLQAKGFLVDLKRRRIIQPDKLQIINGVLKGVPSSICSISKASSNEFAKLLHGRADLITPTFSMETPKHGVRHHIVTHGSPVHAHSRRLPQEKLKPTKEEYRILEELGIVRRSKSPYSSPIHVVPKAEWGYRPCGDFRRLNCQTEDDKYPTPRIHDFTTYLAGKTIFSKVDLVRGYHQVPVHPADVPK